MLRLPTLLVALLLVTLTACAAGGPAADTAPAAEGDAEPSIVFSRDVLPVVQTKFAPLLAEEPGLALDSWAGLVAGSDHGAVLVPFDADRSLMVRLARELPADHPLRPAADRVTDEELALVRRWIEAGARDDDGRVPFEDDGPRLYVSNQDEATVSVIDMERHVVVRVVDLRDHGMSANAKPHHVVVEPGGAHWYVSLIGENRVLKFDRANRLVGQTAFEVPGMLALDPDGRRLWVGRSMSAVNPPQRIGVVNRSDMTAAEEVEVFFPRPHALAVAPGGGVAFSGSLAQNRIAAVDTETLDVELTTLDGPTHTFVQFALAPDGRTMVAGGQISNELLFFDVTDPFAPELTGSLDVPAMPWHPLYTPDGRHIYFGNKGMGAVTVVDAERREVVEVIRGEGLAQPHGSAVRPDGRFVYITNNNLNGSYTPRYPLGGEAPGTVVAIDTETREIARVIEVGRNPTGAGGPAAP